MNRRIVVPAFYLPILSFFVTSWLTTPLVGWSILSLDERDPVETVEAVGTMMRFSLRTTEKKSAMTQMNIEAMKAWLIALVNASAIAGCRWPTVPRKTASTSTGGIEAAATANATAKLQTMPTLRIVFKVADATPNRLRGAAFIVVLVLGDQKSAPPSPIKPSARANIP